MDISLRFSPVVLPHQKKTLQTCSTHLENKLLLISINFTPKLKKWYFPMFCTIFLGVSPFFLYQPTKKATPQTKPATSPPAMTQPPTDSHRHHRHVPAPPAVASILWRPTLGSPDRDPRTFAFFGRLGSRSRTLPTTANFSKRRNRNKTYGGLVGFPMKSSSFEKKRVDFFQILLFVFGEYVEICWNQGSSNISHCYVKALFVWGLSESVMNEIQYSYSVKLYKNKLKTLKLVSIVKQFPFFEVTDTSLPLHPFAIKWFDVILCILQVQSETFVGQDSQEIHPPTSASVVWFVAHTAQRESIMGI